MTRNAPIARALLLAAGLGVATPVAAVDPAQRPENLPAYEHESARQVTEAREGEVWKEGEIDLPPFPAERDLVRLDPADIGDRFAYYLDRGSLSLGEDGVTRYVIVLESSTGVRNVFFEGVRCETSEARTYAYGLPRRETFQSMHAGWRRLARHGAKAYQIFLADGLFCVAETNRARPADEIRDRIARLEFNGTVGSSLSVRRQ